MKKTTLQLAEKKPYLPTYTTLSTAAGEVGGFSLLLTNGKVDLLITN